jgi:hypothetical protein
MSIFGDSDAAKDLQRLKGSNAGKPVLTGQTSIDIARQRQAGIAAVFVQNAVDNLEDPAFDSFEFMIDFADNAGLFADESYVNSALAYLKRTKETVRYELLTKVRSMLMNMLEKRPYLFQSIDGLSSLNETYSKVGQVASMNLQVLDNVRWEMRFITTSLNEIFYDKQRQIEVLPINLRRFSMIINISDVRDLQEVEDKQGVQTFVTNGLRQFYQIQSPVCYMTTSPLPEALSNYEQSELKHTITLSMMFYKIVTNYSALDYVMEFDKPDLENAKVDSSRWANIKKRAKAKIMSSLVGLVDASYAQIKAYAMTKAYEVLEDTGIVNAVNQANAWLSVAKVNELASDVLRDKIAEQVYFKDVRYVDSTANKGTNYSPDLQAYANKLV